MKQLINRITAITCNTKPRIGQTRFTYTNNVGNGINLSIVMEIHLMCRKMVFVALGVGDSKAYKKGVESGVKYHQRPLPTYIQQFYAVSWAVGQSPNDLACLDSSN